MDWALFEGTDFFLDMETSTPNTRRCRGEAMNYYAGDVEADEDYVTFFRDLLNVWDAKFVGEDDDEDDPHYKAFLENLKEHGNGYMCDVSIEHGVLSPLIYEVENNSPSPSPTEIKRKTPRARASACIPGKRKLYKGDRDSKYKSSGAKSDSHDKLKRRVKVVDDIKSGPRVRSDGIKRRSPLSGSGDCVRENRKSVRENRKSEVVDEVYGKFLNNLHVVEDFVFYEYGDGERVFYDTSDEQTMDVEIQPLKTITRPLMLNLRPPTLSLSPAPAPIPRPPTPSSREQIAQRKPIPHDRSMLSVSVRVLLVIYSCISHVLVFVFMRFTFTFILFSFSYRRRRRNVPHCGKSYTITLDSPMIKRSMMSFGRSCLLESLYLFTGIHVVEDLTGQDTWANLTLTHILVSIFLAWLIRVLLFCRFEKIN